MSRQLVIYDIGTLRAKQVFLNGGFHEPDYSGRTDCDFDPDLSNVSGDFKYWKRSSGTWIMQTAGEQASTDATIAQAALLVARAGADAIKDLVDQDGIGWRAVELLIIDQFNILRQRDNDRALDIANATSLADLKVRAAARSAFTDLTITQAKTAYSGKISSGSAG